MQNLKLSNSDIQILLTDEQYAKASPYVWCLLRNPTSISIVAKIAGESRTLGSFLLDAKESGLWVDHEDRNPLNYSPENLRLATPQQNGANRRDDRSNFKFKQKGFLRSKRNGKYYAKIKVNGITHSLGGYFTQEEAARAYDKAAKKYFGKFASLNFPETKL